MVYFCALESLQNYSDPTPRELLIQTFHWQSHVLVIYNYDILLSLSEIQGYFYSENWPTRLIIYNRSIYLRFHVEVIGYSSLLLRFPLLAPFNILIFLLFPKVSNILWLIVSINQKHRKLHSNYSIYILSQIGLYSLESLSPSKLTEIWSYLEVSGNRPFRESVNSLWLMSFWSRDRNIVTVIEFNGKVPFLSFSAKSKTFCLLVLSQPT